MSQITVQKSHFICLGKQHLYKYIQQKTFDKDVIQFGIRFNNFNQPRLSKIGYKYSIKIVYIVKKYSIRCFGLYKI